MSKNARKGETVLNSSKTSVTPFNKFFSTIFRVYKNAALLLIFGNTVKITL